MKRRKLILALAGISAGCQNTPSAGETESSPTETDPKTSNENPNERKTTANSTSSPEYTSTAKRLQMGQTAELQHGVLQVAQLEIRTDGLYFIQPDAPDVYSGQDWLVYFKIYNSGESISSSNFKLRANDEIYEANQSAWGTDDGYLNGELIRVVERIESDDSAWIIFDVSKVDSNESAELIFESNEQTSIWEFKQAHLDQLRADPPEFNLKQVSVPSTVPDSGTIPVSFTVENVGTREGYFVGSFNESGLAEQPHPFEVKVDAGETKKWEAEFDNRGGEDTIRYYFEHPNGEMSFELEPATSTE